MYITSGHLIGLLEYHFHQNFRATSMGRRSNKQKKPIRAEMGWWSGQTMGPESVVDWYNSIHIAPNTLILSYYHGK